LLWEIDKNPNEYPEVIKNIYYKLCISKRGDFTFWIDSFSKKFGKDLIWWSSIPSTRDPFISSIFKNYCIIQTIIFFNNKFLLKIVTSKRENYLTLLKLNRTYKFRLIYKKECDLKNYFKNFFYLFYSISYYFIIYFLIKIFAKKKKLSKYPIFINTFALEGSENNEKVFLGFDKLIKKKKINNIYFVPNFIFNKKVIFLILRLIKKDFFLFRENYINFKEILYALLIFFRKKKLLQYKYKFNKLDLSELFYAEFKSVDQYFSKITCILNFIFAKKLKDLNINVKKTINTFENQILEKGWNLGFRTFFKKTKVYGYQGYTNFIQYINHYPSKMEEKFNVIPQKIILPGKAYRKAKYEFNKNLKIINGPAFRFINIHRNNNIIRKKYKIVIILSGIQSSDQFLIDIGDFILKENQIKKIYVKPHPTLKVKHLKFYNKKLIISKLEIHKICQSNTIVICCGPTSASVEGILYGSTLICPIFDPFDKLNLIQYKILKNKYTFVKNKEQILMIIKNIFRKKIEKKIINKNYFFQKINQKNIKIFT